MALYGLIPWAEALLYLLRSWSLLLTAAPAAAQLDTLALLRERDPDRSDLVSVCLRLPRSCALSDGVGPVDKSGFLWLAVYPRRRRLYQDCSLLKRGMIQSFPRQPSKTASNMISHILQTASRAGPEQRDGK
jgi:hypothetical protein